MKTDEQTLVFFIEDLYSIFETYKADHDIIKDIIVNIFVKEMMENKKTKSDAIALVCKAWDLVNDYKNN